MVFIQDVNNIIIGNILERKFDDAKKQYDQLSFSDFKRIIEINSFENPNWVYYDFLSYLLNSLENEELHSFASELLATSLCHFENAYQKAYHHANKALEFKKNYVENLEWLLFFYSIPDRLLTKEKARETVIAILKNDESNKQALNFITKYFNEEEKKQIHKKL